MNDALIISLATGNCLANITYDESGRITSLEVNNSRKWIITYNGGDLATIEGPSRPLPITFNVTAGVVTGYQSAAGAFACEYDDNARLIRISPS